ncbi:hypothetical protein CC2G_004587 [Coprinopsis cinerea AmutBmut pab1-1]|nr:hypothetical protein CC2G_004587 [Coprinopsis cinerea AmutBmut pab1-1]
MSQEVHEHTPKRIRLENDADSTPGIPEIPVDKVSEDATMDGGNEEEGEDSCSICLHTLEDRTVIPKCSHEFCFECLLVWTGQSRRCPLCNQPIGDYIIHSIRSRFDYRKHFLAPLRSSPPPEQPSASNPVVNARRNAIYRRRERERRRRGEELSELDRFERSLAKRRWIYRHHLYAKHVASNSYTKFRPYPSPAVFAASPDLISRTTTFLRRELQVWEGLDVEFLTTLIISLMKSIDIRSESAVKLLSEFLDLDAPYVPGGRHVNAEHFAHEVYCYVRSPYKDLFMYDTIVQYDTPPELQPPPESSRRRRWDQSSRSRSQSPSNSSQTQRRPHQEPERRDVREDWQSSPWSSNSRSTPSTGTPHDHPPIASSSRRTLPDNPAFSGPPDNGNSREIAGPSNDGGLQEGSNRSAGVDPVETRISDAAQSDMAKRLHDVVDLKGKGKAVPREDTSFGDRHADFPTSDTGASNKKLINSGDRARPPRDVLASIQAYLTSDKSRPTRTSSSTPKPSRNSPSSSQYRAPLILGLVD